LKYILPLKRFLHITGIRRAGNVPLQRRRMRPFARIKVPD
jgi:hypothetical protein